MSLGFRSTMLVTSLTLLMSAGCQTGKLSLPKLTMPQLSMPKLEMPKLAFWEKDTLSEDDIQPPSYQYSPSESSDEKTLVADNQPAGLPTKPKLEEPSEALDRFRSEMASTYGDLASKTESASKEIEGYVARTQKNMQNEMDRQKQNGGEFVANIKRDASPLGERLASAGELTPRFDAKPSKEVAPEPAMNDNRSSGSGFQPSKGPLPRTRYEQIAESTMGNPLQPKPGNANRSNSAGNSQAANDKVPQHVINQHFGGNNSTPSGSGSSQVSYDQYPSTGYDAFQPRSQAGPAEHQVATVGELPEALLLGQGTYAPGSVRAPSPMKPEQVAIPKRSASNSVPGGSFLGR